MPSANDIAENAYLKLFSRLSMSASAVGLTALVWFGGQWLDQRFAASDAALSAAVRSITTSISSLDDRVRAIENANLPVRMSVIETTISTKGVARDRQVSDLDTRIDGIENSTNAKLEKLLDAVGDIKTDVAALKARAP